MPLNLQSVLAMLSRHLGREGGGNQTGQQNKKSTPRSQQMHLLLSHVLLFMFCIWALNLTSTTPSSLGWHKAAMPLGLYTIFAVLWFVGLRIQRRRRAKSKKTATTPSVYRHYTARIYSAWFILCTAYGAWVIWGYPSPEAAQPAVAAVAAPAALTPTAPPGTTAPTAGPTTPPGKKAATPPPVPAGTTAPTAPAVTPPPATATTATTTASDSQSTLGFLALPRPYEASAKAGEASAKQSWGAGLVETALLPLTIIAFVLEKFVILIGLANTHQYGLFPEPAGSFGTFLAGLNKQTVLTTTIPAMMVFLFAFPMSALQAFKHDREDASKWLKEIADDTYFIGFLLTLAGLSSALLGITLEANGLLMALGKAGGAISTTFVAVVMRVLLLDVVTLQATTKKKGATEDTSDEETQSENEEQSASVVAPWKRLVGRVLGMGPLPPSAATSCFTAHKDCRECEHPCSMAAIHKAIDGLAPHPVAPTAAPSTPHPGNTGAQHHDLNQGIKDIQRQLQECCDRLKNASTGTASAAIVPAEFLTALDERIKAFSPAPPPPGQSDKLLAELAEQIQALALRQRDKCDDDASSPSPSSDPAIAQALSDISSRLDDLVAATQQTQSNIIQATQQGEQSYSLMQSLLRLGDEWNEEARQSFRTVRDDLSSGIGTMASKLSELIARCRCLINNDPPQGTRSAPPPPPPPPHQTSNAAALSTPPPDDLIQQIAQGVISSYSGRPRLGR